MYQYRPHKVRAFHWTDPANPPPGVYNVSTFSKPCCPRQTFYKGFVATMKGKESIELGDWLVLDRTGFKNVYPKDLFQFYFEELS